jgi:hypothetical protein
MMIAAGVHLFGPSLLLILPSTPDIPLDEISRLTAGSSRLIGPTTTGSVAIGISAQRRAFVPGSRAHEPRIDGTPARLNWLHGWLDARQE